MKIISGSEFNFDNVELMDYKLHKVRLKRGGSYIKSSEWLVYKTATTNPKNEEDDECFQDALGLSYNEIRKKRLENILKRIRHEDTDFSSHQRDWENFERNNESIALNVLFASQNSEEITLVYKSEYNFKRKNNMLFLMINDDDDSEKYYFFAVKSKFQLYLSEWLRSKKEAIINSDNCFQNALNDALGFQSIKNNAQEISKIRSYINQYNWKDLKFPPDKEDWKKFEQNNKEILLYI